MNTIDNTQVEAIRTMTNKEMVIAITTLQAQVLALTEKLSGTIAVRNTSDREMTDDDARNILTGECATLKHKQVAEKLGLSYGQVYSCRGEYTFKHIHKEMKDSGQVNPWAKK